MPSLPLKGEMDELDGLLERASGILMRWRFKMTPGERMEFPTVFNIIDKAEVSMAALADALTVISTELGFGILREEAGLREAVRHGSYVIFTNLDTGETKQYYNAYPPDSSEVAESAAGIKSILEERWSRNLKVEIKSISEVEESAGRSFPKTYSDWVSLGEDIKGKDPTASTILEVNNALYYILEEEKGEADEDAGYTADDAKIWLTEKAGELGIK